MNAKVVLAVLVALAVGLVGGLALGGTGTEPPENDSVAAGFARDMQTHHDQAVQMSFIIRSRTDDDAVRSLAYDIARTQSHQSGQMAGWLDAWGLPATGPDDSMDWMKRAGDDHGGSDMMEDGRMRGMASEEELEKLKSLRGKEADILYLQLMIDHHKGGVPMAKAVLDCGVEPVENLAEAMITSQTAEVKAMKDMLERRGAQPRSSDSP